MALRPPGHAPHVLDVIGLDASTLRAADVPLWHGLGSLAVERFAGWGRPVTAPADGTVVSSHDGQPDRPRVSFLTGVPRILAINPLRNGKDLGAMAGNHVVVEVDGGFVLLAHLRCGSVVVCDGESVVSGDALGEVGNSGNSLLPHLHVQAMTSSDPFTAQPLPWHVTALESHHHGRWVPGPGVVPLRAPMRSP